MSGDFLNSSTNCKQTEKYLENWSQWLEVWKNTRQALERTIQRRPEEMLMTNLDKVRTDNEEKDLLQFSKICTYFDKYRGKPDYWKLPAQLAQKPCQPQYFSVKTKPEQYIIPEVENIGFAKVIQDERNVLQNARIMCSKWQNSLYRKQQMEKFSAQISNIQPHKPIMEHLVVVGTKIREVFESENEEENKTITSTDMSNVETEDKKVLEEAKPEKPLLEFKLNGITFGGQEASNSIKLHLSFEYNLSAPNTNNKQVLSFENSGRVTIRLNWAQIEKHRLLKAYTINHGLDYGFCFNKNQILLLPGQILEFPIWFKSDRPGSFSENWELTIDPPLWDQERVHVVLSLHCYSYYKDMQEKLQGILKSIELGSRNLQIQNIIKDLTHDLKYRNIVLTPCVVDEAQLFETTNSIKGIPLVLYNKTLCKNLEEFYQKIKTETCADVWNYSIRVLQTLAKRKDILAFLEIKKHLALQLFSLPIAKPTESKKSSDKISKTLNKPKPSKNKKNNKQKQIIKTESKVDNTMKSAAEPFTFQYRTDLDNIVKQLDYSVIFNKNRLKYSLCVQVMSSYFTKMTKLLECLEQKLNVHKIHVYPSLRYSLVDIDKLPERLIYERFDCDYLSSESIILEKQSKLDKPKPKNLQEIPIEDVETLYSIYFNKPLSPIKGERKNDKKDNKKKSKKGKSTKSSKKGKNKSEKSSKVSKMTTDINDEIEELGFDPYEEIFIYKPTIVPASTLSKSQEIIPPEISNQYKLESYLIVYTCLSDAVGGIIDTLHSFECSVDIKTLDNILKCSHK